MGAKLAYGQVQRSAMNWPFYIAAELGLFSSAGLEVERQIFSAPPEPVKALLEGSLDVASVIPDAALCAIVNGAPLSLIANINTRPQYRLLARPEINNIEELRGERIGVNDGLSAEALILKRHLRKNGLADDSYELFLCGPPPQRCERLREGAIAATMISQPFDFALEEEGFRCLASSAQIVPHYPFTVAVIRSDKDFSEVVLHFLQCLERAWRWLADPANKKNAVSILSRFTETSEREAEATYDLYLHPPTPPSLAPAEEGIATVLELLADSERLKRPLPAPRRFIDRRYFEKLIKS